MENGFLTETQQSRPRNPLGRFFFANDKIIKKELKSRLGTPRKAVEKKSRQYTSHFPFCR